MRTVAQDTRELAEGCVRSVAPRLTSPVHRRDKAFSLLPAPNRLMALDGVGVRRAPVVSKKKLIYAASYTEYVIVTVAYRGSLPGPCAA